MAYDGFVVAASVSEFREKLLGGKINKIVQTEKDEIFLHIRSQGSNHRLQLSVNPSLPLCSLTELNKPAPLTAPAFCMALRKYLGGGSIVGIRQPSVDFEREGLERVIVFEVEHIDELGDRGRRLLIIELMGKHSNLILCREDKTILDSIKHISAGQSSVREVLPARSYFIPDTEGKIDPCVIGEQAFRTRFLALPMPAYQALYRHFTGISPLSAAELCAQADMDPDLSANCQHDAAVLALYRGMQAAIQQIKSGKAEPNIVYRNGVPEEFSALCLKPAAGGAALPLVWAEGGGTGEAALPEHYIWRSHSMSAVIQRYYADKDRHSRIRQKSADLSRNIHKLLERCAKKLQLQEKQFADCAQKDKFKQYGELLLAYGFGLKEGEQQLVCENFYDGSQVSIPLDTRFSAADNAQQYFQKYNKLKRTEENLSRQLTETRAELAQLESISLALKLAENEADLESIRRELSDYGYLKKSGAHTKKTPQPSQPLHFTSSDGFDMYVGKNNYQNEYLSFKLAEGSDLWFHAKNIPGSHVIVKAHGQDLPDQTYLEAARLAAYYSSAKDSPRVEVDYTHKRQLKKVPGGAPGFVIYHQNWSMLVEPGLPQTQREAGS